MLNEFEQSKPGWRLPDSPGNKTTSGRCAQRLTRIESSSLPGKRQVSREPGEQPPRRLESALFVVWGWHGREIDRRAELSSHCRRRSVGCQGGNGEQPPTFPQPCQLTPGRRDGDTAVLSVAVCTTVLYLTSTLGDTSGTRRHHVWKRLACHHTRPTSMRGGAP